ncbi:serine/threonine-protein kinase TNNI3K-like isoform X2 [Oscarella lobularis]|uniref:serine/threonine-protein kinase TNNI3K-like isoform X2 n=1 Tax=Oscarella lobularis TaxID=121494 RepID=UPI003313172E
MRRNQSQQVYDFFSAAGNGKMTKVQNYVRKNPHSWIVAADEDGYRAIHYASKSGHGGTVSYLHALGADLETETKLGYTPFLVSVKNRHVNLVDYLVKSGCNVHAVAKDGHGALDLACWNNDLKTVETLIQAGVNINEHHQKGFTALHFAAQLGYEPIAVCLIESGANIDALDASGFTPFMRAVLWNHQAVAEVLVKSGCDVHVRATSGNDALALASEKGWHELVRLCLNKHVDVNGSNRDGFIALHHAVMSNEIIVIELLLSHGANIEATDAIGYTPFLRAVESNRACLVDVLCHAGCNIEAETILGEGALELAIVNGNVDLCCLLVRKGLSPLQRTQFGETMIELAEKENKRKIAAYLKMKVQQQPATSVSERNLHLTEELQECRQQLDEARRLIAYHEEATRSLREAERDLKSYEDVLQIPIEDVQLTDFCLGEGSYGKVKVGFWRGCKVAVKMCHELLNTAYYLDLFKQEMAVNCRIRHPNIVALCGVTTVDGLPLRIITQLLEGCLRDVINASFARPLSLRERVDLAIGFTSAISYLHSLTPRPVLHGDIRSTNILVTALMEAKLCDLGAARFLGDSRAKSAGPLSPAYLAPERDESGRQSNTPMADVFSLGVTLVELMTSQQPCQKMHESHAARILCRPVQAICLAATDVAPEKRPLALQCLSVLEGVCKSDEYKACPPKRMMKGKFHNNDNVVELVECPWV